MPQAKIFTQTYSQLTNVLSTEVLVGPAFNLKELSQPTHTNKYGGIWDTGATGSVITKKVVTECGLKPIGMKKMITAGGTRVTPEYLIAIRLPNGVGIPMIRVLETDDLGPNSDLLIGMDIIALGDFVITNLNGKTTFSFRIPSMQRIDFLEETNTQVIHQRPKIGRNDPCPCKSGKKYKKCCALKS